MGGGLVEPGRVSVLLTHVDLAMRNKTMFREVGWVGGGWED